MMQNGIGFRILVRDVPITEYHHTDGQIYVEGRHGSPYEIEVTNGRSTRIAAVISVDGLSIMDGTTASATSGAYILERNGHLLIPGWKLPGHKEAAKFVFGGNYAATMTGSTRNDGVIGAIFFDEERFGREVGFHPVDRPDFWKKPWKHPKPWRHDPFYYEFEQERSPRMMGSANVKSASIASDSNMATGFGPAVGFETREEAFRRGHEVGRIAIYYDGARGLRRRGIEVGRAVSITESTLPQAFPADGCQPPPGWRW
jgi:hypothetical protein